MARCIVCGMPASAAWSLTACSLKPRRKRRYDLCAKHDIKLNEMVVRYLHGRKRNSDLAAYRTAEQT